MTDPKRAVFLSYASQNAEPAQRLCNALRAAGIEVWFDRSELRGGDAWDQKIRQQIRDCTLFLPIISRSTQARSEGYFRLEWRLADQRTHLMGRSRAFLVPICVDNTSEKDADVPDSFSAVQWTRLPDGAPTSEFVARVTGLLTAPEAEAAAVRLSQVGHPLARQSGPRRWPIGVAVAVVAAIASIAYYLSVEAHRKPPSPPGTSAEDTMRAASPKIPEKSVAVLPFVDMSEKHDQEYFADGLAEELLDLLAQVPDLKVPARTSAFYFRGRSTTVPEIARALGVQHVLEGSVRKAGGTVRVAVQLIRADSGYQLWSSTFDRDIKDVFKVQDEIASAVAQALRTQLALSTALVGARLTSSPEAHDLYLRGRESYSRGTVESDRESISLFEQATAADPSYAAAYAALAHARGNLMIDLGRRETPEEAADRLREAERAIELGPQLADGYAVRGITYLATGNWKLARDDLEKAVSLDPKDARSLRFQSRYYASQGNLVRAIAIGSRAIALDPFDAYARAWRAQFELADGQRDAARADLAQALRISPSNRKGLSVLAFIDIGDRRLDEAAELAKALPSAAMRIPLESAIGCARGATRKALESLDRWKAVAQDQGLALTVAAYASCGDTGKALDALEADVLAPTHLLGETLEILRYHPYFAALHDEPRFKALLRKVGLTN
jgi:TolB-like protein